MQIFTSRHGIRILASILTLSVFLLSGCGSKYGNQTTAVHYFPQCYAPIDDLRKSEAQFNQTVGTGVALGVLSGAVLGLIASGGKAEGAAIGAAAGGAAGGAAGYAKAKSDETSEDNRLMSQYLNAIEGDISGLNRVTAAGRMALQCYDRQFKLSLDAFKAHRITKAELQSKYEEIRSGTFEAQSIMGEALGDVRVKEDQFRNAVAEEARRTSQPVPTMTAASEPDTPQVVKSSQTQKKSSTKKTAQAKPAPVRKQPSTDLEKLAQKTETLSTSRAQLENEYSSANAMQKAWSQDLAAIQS